MIFRIDLKGQTMKKVLFVYGKQVCPRVYFSSTNINFKDCFVKEVKEHEIELFNKTEGLPVKIKIKRDPFLTFYPNEFTIPPLFSQKVLIRVK